MKTEMIKFRVSGEEGEEIRQRADMTGETVSEFVRTQSLRGRVVPREAINELIREVNKVGVNINQLARRANESGHDAGIYQEAVNLVEEFRELIFTVQGRGK